MGIAFGSYELVGIYQLRNAGHLSGVWGMGGNMLFKRCIGVFINCENRGRARLNRRSPKSSFITGRGEVGAESCLSPWHKNDSCMDFMQRSYLYLI